jgi:predicted RNA-binding Zn-ribbon protein involved in translation (DUF1610 family)
MFRGIRYLSAIELLAVTEGLPVCVCCGERLASIDYCGDELCPECGQMLAAQGEPIAKYGKQIKARPPR